MGTGVKSLGFEVEGLGFRGLSFRVWGRSGEKVCLGLGCMGRRALALGFGVEGLGHQALTFRAWVGGCGV